KVTPRPSNIPPRSDIAALLPALCCTCPSDPAPASGRRPRQGAAVGDAGQGRYRESARHRVDPARPIPALLTTALLTTALLTPAPLPPAAPARPHRRPLGRIVPPPPPRHRDGDRDPAHHQRHRRAVEAVAAQRP